MREGRRLLVAGSERERALLRAGVSEAPTNESVRAAARVVGLVPRAAVFAYCAAVLAKAVKWSSLNGYVLAPALAFGAIGVGYTVAKHRSTETASVALHAAASGRPAASAGVIPGAGSTGATSKGIAEDEGTAEPNPASGELASPHGAGEKGSGPEGAWNPASVRAGIHGASSDALQEQVGLVDRARSLVASGDANGALRAVDAYEHRFPRGLLSEEASLLRIQAMAARGDRGAAAMLAQRFRTMYPRSVHTDTIRWLLGDGSN
jgi:hypothetical protein